MTPERVRDQVHALLRRIAPEIDPSTLQGDQALRAQIDFDSMDALNLFAGLTESFSIDVPETDYGRLQCLDDLIAYVVERTGASGG